jgi:hypothetical protein
MIRMSDAAAKFGGDWLDEVRIPRVGKAIYDRPDIDTVYHYTSAAGLLGIISLYSVWATDVEYLNDAQELKYAAKELLHALRGELQIVSWQEQKAAGNLDHSLAAELRRREVRRNRWTRHMLVGNEARVEEALRSTMRDLEKICGPSESSPLHVYVSCFCENGDLLSQWRGYGGIGGYSIGFRVEALEGLARNFTEGEFLRICYGFKDAVAQSRDILPKYLESGVSLRGSYLKALTMIKNEAFKEEKEWRLMIPEDDSLKKLEFRVGPVGVTPYVPVRFLPDAVKTVIVGPGQHTAERINGTHRLLERFQMAHVEVKPSETSLRI